MENKYYLYGASIQGIQSFIFKTNKLKEIAGASSLVEDICKDVFAECLGKKCFEDLENDPCSIINAAGNIKYIFKSEDDCKRVVRSFPKIISHYAPGVTVSQAVIPADNIESANDNIEKLETLLRIQSNKPMRNQQIGLMGISRSRSTGLPATDIYKSDYVDKGTYCKSVASDLDTFCEKAFDKKIGKNSLPLDLNDIKGYQSWIAVIHADGNGLGKVVRKIGKKVSTFKEFSRKLDVSTRNAFKLTIDELNNKYNLLSTKKVPIRPVVLGGDDMTVICRGDLAMELTHLFIKNFEEQTRLNIGGILKENKIFTEGEKSDCLTCCAGIAYIKSSYPFYYGYNLAESLCDYAKKKARTIVSENESTPSCIMFHKIQDSFVEGYESIERRELTISDDENLQNGPYYLNSKKGYWTVKDLISISSLLCSSDMNPIKSSIRQWISLMVDGKNVLAEQKLNRLKSIHSSDKEIELINKLTSPLCRDAISSYPAYDVLSISSIIKMNDYGYNI